MKKKNLSEMIEREREREMYVMEFPDRLKAVTI